MKVLVLGLSLSVVALSSPRAEVALSGYFIARDACPALQSIKKGTNPGDVHVVNGHSYKILAKNRPAATHYRVEVEGSGSAGRWVSVGCGEHVVSADGSTAIPHAGGGDSVRPKEGGSDPSWVLAVSWQPAFCELKPQKVECKTQTAGRFDADHFALHGLWPQPRRVSYCQVAPDLVLRDKNKDWGNLPEPVLEEETRKSLDRVMPGTASLLQRHEWIKHGTCAASESADDYFASSIRLMDELNGTVIQTLFARSIGRELTNVAIRDAFDEAFGDGAGDRIRIACDKINGRNLITEITIGLVGDISSSVKLGELIAAAEPTDAGCPSGVVDPVGHQ